MRCIVVAIMALGLLLCAQSRADSELANNCGLNCAFSLARLFGRPSELSRLAEELNVGSQRDQELSFRDLQTFCQKRDLTAEGMKADTLNELLRVVPPGSVVVVRTKLASGGVNVFHFFLIAPFGEKTLLIDPSRHRSGVLPTAELPGDPRLASATGEYLVVHDPKADGPRISVLSESVDIGTIPLHQEDIVAQIGLRNSGRQPLKVGDIRSSCGCMERADVKGELAPGEFGVVTVKFNKAGLPKGEVTRQVMIPSNDTQHPAVVVPVHIFIQDQPSAEDVRIAPRHISFGRATDTEIRKRPIQIQVTVPGDGEKKLSSVVIEGDDKIDFKLLGETSVPTDADAPACRRTYLLNWLGPLPEGPLDRTGHVTIHRPDKPDLSIAIKVVGDVIAASATRETGDTR